MQAQVAKLRFQTKPIISSHLILHVHGIWDVLTLLNAVRCTVGNEEDLYVSVFRKVY